MPERVRATRNYSFEHSRRLPDHRMTEINGVKIPAVPGSCYHGILCSLAQNKNRFCTWERICEATEKFMRQYGGDKGWRKFSKKRKTKDSKIRIQYNCHTLTRTGVNCYSLRLHEKGMTIYYFRDGAILFTDGTFKRFGARYSLTFPDGRGLQKRYRGFILSYGEYKKYLEKKYIDICGTILDHNAIRAYRVEFRESVDDIDNLITDIGATTRVCVTLVDSFDQSTADRLLGLGLVVEKTNENEITGHIPTEYLTLLCDDQDVVNVTAEETVS